MKTIHAIGSGIEMKDLRFGAALILGAAGLVTQVSSFSAHYFSAISRPQTRLMLEILCFALFTSACLCSMIADRRISGFGRGSSALRVTATTVIWGFVSLIPAALFGTELYLRSVAAIPAVSIDGPMFAYGNSGGPSDRYERWPFPRPAKPDFMVNNQPADRQEYLKRRDIDNFIYEKSIGNEFLKRLYKSPLDEHFLVGVTRSRYCDIARISDILVTVTDYEQVPPPTQAGVGAFSVENRLMIVFDIHPLDSDLPWSFSPSYLLADPADESVAPWNRASVSLEDDRQKDLIVVVVATKPGIYTYHADVVTRDSLGTLRTEPLVKKTEPRKVFVEWSRASE